MKMGHIKPMLSVFLAIISSSAVSNGQMIQMTPTCSAVVECQSFDILDNGCNDWILAFRGTPHVGAKVLSAYKDGTGVPQKNQIGCLQVDPNLPCSHHYRNNDVLDNWIDIDEVAFMVYNQSGLAHYIVFNGKGSNYMNWFSADRVKNSSWIDLTISDHPYFSIEGFVGGKSQRRFYISQAHTGSCNSGYAWVMIDEKDPGENYCSWLTSHKYPIFKYAVRDYAAFRPSADYADASLIAVFVKFLQ